MVKKNRRCRICKQTKLTRFLNLGNIPLPNGFLPPEEISKSEPTFPLSVGLCNHCGLVQLMETVSPEVMFRNYVYIPSASKTRMNNFADITSTARERFQVSDKSLVIDIGSNDGSLLSFFKAYGINTLGIDPATNLAKIAELKGIHTINDYVSASLARKIRKEKGPAHIVTATNVVAHINDLHDLLRSIEILLDDNGVFICEFPYLLDLIEKNLFDTIYHEHLSYFSVNPLVYLLNQVNLELLDIERTNIDGGSLRVFIRRKRKNTRVSSKIKNLIKKEQEFGLMDLKRFKDFAAEVKKFKHELKTLLVRLKKNGKSIAVYGAAAKGNILLNYCNITNKLIDFAVDSTPYKQGLYMPGSRIRIFPESEILARQPNYTLILAWNFADEIMNKEKSYRARGGKFIIPVPHPTIVD